jgi:hypothetical protein
MFSKPFPPRDFEPARLRAVSAEAVEIAGWGKAWLTPSHDPKRIEATFECSAENLDLIERYRKEHLRFEGKAAGCSGSSRLECTYQVSLEVRLEEAKLLDGKIVRLFLNWTGRDYQLTSLEVNHAPKLSTRPIRARAEGPLQR